MAIAVTTEGSMVIVAMGMRCADRRSLRPPCHRTGESRSMDLLDCDRMGADPSPL